MQSHLFDYLDVISLNTQSKSNSIVFAGGKA